MSVISTNALTHRYGDIQALDAVDVEIPGGSIGLVGANGAGKTTLLKVLMGTLVPAHGGASVLGFDPQREPLELRAKLGYMPEGSFLLPDMIAADFVTYAGRLGGLPAPEAKRRASHVLTLVGLAEERFRPLGGFSTGMRQRAKLACALVHDPELLLLDEPTAGLDPEGREEMLDLIRRLGVFGMHVVVSSHVLRDIERTCDWVVMLDRGGLLRNGPIEERTTDRAVMIELFDDPTPLAQALAAAGAMVTPEGERILHVEVTTGDPFGLVTTQLAATGVGLRRMGLPKARLEDVYFGGEEA